jgi:hypothetical protein
VFLGRTTVLSLPSPGYGPWWVGWVIDGAGVNPQPGDGLGAVRGQRLRGGVVYEYPNPAFSQYPLDLAVFA